MNLSKAAFGNFNLYTIETGDIKLSLWNDDTARVKAGDKVKITNGYVSEWQGELQLTTGKATKRSE